MTQQELTMWIASSRLEAHAKALIETAKTLGLVLTIQTEPAKPLAMGNHSMVAEVRPANVIYRMGEK